MVLQLNVYCTFGGREEGGREEGRKGGREGTREKPGNQLVLPVVK